MNKKELCKMFTDKLGEWGVTHRILNDGFHIQVQNVNNFYPTKRSYYNSQTGGKCHYPEFTSSEDFLKWLSKQNSIEGQMIKMSPKQVVEILQDCEDLKGAIEYFEQLKQESI